MRPPGDLRLALCVAAGQGPGTLRELAQRSQVGFDAARSTVGNMARAGVLRVVGEQHVDYRNRLVQVYELAAPLTTTVGQLQGGATVPSAPATTPATGTSFWDVDAVNAVGVLFGNNP